MKKFKAIIVDDHPALRMAVKHLIERDDEIEVVAEADNGQTALDLVRRMQPNLVVVDIDIPKINGLELIERLHSTNPEIKILVLSGLNQDVYALRAMQAGANGFIGKNQDITSIRHAAGAILSGYNMFPAIAMTSGGRKNALGGVHPDALSDRELTVLGYLAKGFTIKDTADALFLSNKTISTYKARIMEKLGMTSLVQLIDYARINKISE